MSVLQAARRLGVAALLAAGQPSQAQPGPVLPPLAVAFAQEVGPRLEVPADAAAAYAARLAQAWLSAGIDPGAATQFVLLVDRSPQVQALVLFWGSPADGWRVVGAAPVSTGLPGRYEHFVTPTGVFAHALANPDFRAEGTRNDLGIRGYGRQGSRIFDFGWVAAPKGWGNRAMSVMRLQVHATDPDLLERRLGSAQSKGCIRIPAHVDEFLDRYGVLDADYDAALAADKGRVPWVLRSDRLPSPWAGRWLVVVDSQAATRPDWSPVPGAR